MRWAQDGEAELSVLRMRLAQEKSNAAALERLLLTTRARRANKPSPGLSESNSRLHEELQCSQLQHEKRLKRHQACVESRESSRTDIVSLQSELRNANSELAEVARYADTLQHEVTGAKRSRSRLEEHLSDVSAITEDMVERQECLQAEAASEWAIARSLRQQLEEKGWGLALLRSTARSHVDGIRGSVNTLDQYVRTNTQEAIAAPLALPNQAIPCDSQGSGSQQRRGYSRSSRGGNSRLL